MEAEAGPGDSPPEPAARERALRALPVLLVALGGACGVSAAAGLVFAVSGRAAPLGLLLAPPIVVLLVAPLYVLRRPSP